jgi:hypothetical protein
MTSHIVEGTLTYPGPELADGFAAHIYADPGNVDAWMDELDNKLGLYVSDVGLNTGDVSVQHVINRARHKAVSASLFHLAELAAGRRFLDAWDPATRSLDLEAYTHNAPEPAPTHYPFTGPYKHYLAIESSVDSAAIAATLEAVQDPEHTYHPVWKAYTRVQPEFAKTDYVVRGFERAETPAADLTETATNVTAHTLIRVIMPTVLQLRRDTTLNGDAIAGRIMTRSEELSWISTLSRRSLLARFPDAGESAHTTPNCPYVIGERDTYISDLPGNSFWDRPDLQDSPRESSSYCPVSNNTELLSEREEDVETTDAIYAIPAAFGARRRLSHVSGAGCAAEMHIIRSIPVLGKTILAAFE